MPEGHFFLDPTEGARARGTALPIPQGGDLAIIARKLKIVNAPLFGQLQITPIAPPTSSLELHFAIDFDGKLLYPTSTDPTTIPWPQGGAVDVYHWGGQASIEVRAVAAGGWDSGVQELLRGDSQTLALLNTGSIEATIPAALAADNGQVVAFASATYVPFAVTPGMSEGEKVGAAFVHFLGGRLFGRSLQGTEHGWIRVPPGDYVVEVWTDSGSDPTPPNDPAPYYVGSATVTPGSTVSLVVN